MSDPTPVAGSDSFIEPSIFEDVKRALGFERDYDVFDADIVMHINSVLFTLEQLGVGPENGFQLEDNTTTWTSYLGPDISLNGVKSYMYLRVRLLLDPPQNSFTLAAFEKQIEQMEWRLNVQVERKAANVTNE